MPRKTKPAPFSAPYDTQGEVQPGLFARGPEEVQLNATFGSLIRLVFGNFLITIATLTLGKPFVQLRNFRFFCGRLQAVGEVDFDAIQQSAHLRPSVGEGLADAFDVGFV